MASFHFLRDWFSLLLLLGLAATCCKSDQDAVGIVGRAMQCFNNHYVYSSCESYRLTAQGSIDVPPEATNEYCGGPCLVETKLVLSCVDNILYNFQFYNGASVRDVMYTLNTGCGHTSSRGDFNVLNHMGYDGEYGGEYYGDGNKVGVPVLMLLFSSFLLLLWGY